MVTTELMYPNKATKAILAFNVIVLLLYHLTWIWLFILYKNDPCTKFRKWTDCDFNHATTAFHK